VRIKIQVVEEDERETGLRKILNFGHTIGHALEQATHYKRLRHGEAVGWGMLAAGRIAEHRGLWFSPEFEKLQSILFRSRCLYPLGKLTSAGVLAALKHDKKKTGKSLNFILPERTGKVNVVKDVTQEQILDALRYIFDINKRRSPAAVR
jgi:3-dehydroquinate synthase